MIWIYEGVKIRAGEVNAWSIVRSTYENQDISEHTPSFRVRLARPWEVLVRAYSVRFRMVCFKDIRHESAG